MRKVYGVVFAAIAPDSKRVGVVWKVCFFTHAALLAHGMLADLHR
jgi:hypothetical protein